jgi:hypothetical protein
MPNGQSIFEMTFSMPMKLHIGWLASQTVAAGSFCPIGTH